MKALSTIVLLSLSVPLAKAGDWPHWRGPTRDGHSPESSGWQSGDWLKADPNWTAQVGEGASSPLVVDGKIYTLGWHDDQDTLRCLELRTGKELWSVRYRCPRYGRFRIGDEGVYSGPSSTPEYDSTTGWLYTLSTDGDLQCWDSKQRGRIMWKINLYDEYGAVQRPKPAGGQLRDYGYTSSPLIHREWLLVEAGSPRGNLIALDKKSGKKVWASQCTDPAGHNGGPAPITIDGIPCVAVLTVKQLVVIRLDSGKEGQTLATYPWATDFNNNVASPAVLGDCVLLTSAYNKKSICKLRITQRGAVKQWEKQYHSKVCTPVIHKGHIYFAWERARCLDWETGEQLWQGGTFSDPGSCVITADDRLLVYGHQGRLALVETATRSPNRYTELARRDRFFRDLAWPHVVLAEGHILCRDRAGNLACFVIGKTK